jgi:hypothetical protein
MLTIKMLLPTLDNQVGISFYSDCAKIGIIFDTNNFLCQKKIVSGDFSLSLHRIRAEQMMIPF